MAITQEFCEQYWTNLGGSTLQNSSTATYHPSRKLSKLDEPDTRDTAREVRTNSYAIYSSGPLHMNEQRQDDKLEPIYNSPVLIQGAALKTIRGRSTIGTCGKRGSGRSVLAVRHDDDDCYVSLTWAICLYTVKWPNSYFLPFQMQTLRVWVNLGAMAIKGYSVFPKSFKTGEFPFDGFVSFLGHSLVYVSVCGTGVFPLCKDAAGVFYGPRVFSSLRLVVLPRLERSVYTTILSISNRGEKRWLYAFLESIRGKGNTNRLDQEWNSAQSIIYDDNHYLKRASFNTHMLYIDLRSGRTIKIGNAPV